MKTAIVTLATGEYWKGANVLFRSLERHGLPDTVDRIVLSNDNVSPDFATRQQITQDYSRIKTKRGQFAKTANKFAAFLLPYDRIIILDSDIFCIQQCSFLWSENMNELPFYAVYDTAAIHYYPDEIRRQGLEENLIFNTGTMVFHPWLMPEMHSAIMKAIGEGWCESYDGGDQGYLNSFFQGVAQETGYLPGGYNYTPDRFMAKLPPESRYLYHFAGGRQPWEADMSGTPECMEYLQQWRQYV